MGFGLQHFIAPGLLQTLQDGQGFAFRDLSVPYAINDVERRHGRNRS